MSEVGLRKEDGVAVVTLDAPVRRNALTLSMAHDLVEVLEEADRDPGVGAVVMQGNGGSFCAGADLGTLAGAANDPASEETYVALSDIYASFVRVGAVKVPTIAAVRGAAVGAGLNLALATDLRIVGRQTRLFSGFTGLGIHPGGGHISLLSRVAGREAAAAMAVFGEEINGERAVQLGLAWDAVGEEDVEARAMELANKVAGDPDLGRAVVRSFRMETAPSSLSWDVAVQAERPSQMWSMRRKAW
jgi:enoyl-CoA hydratase